MGKVALIIIYNHKFVKNVNKLEALYSSRFSHIYHLMPFYKGTQSNIIPVYEHSYYFQGYISQAIQRINSNAYDYFFFVADDLFLNPEINEQNFTGYFGINPDTGFIPYIQELHKRPHTSYWSRIRLAAEFTIEQDGIDIKNELPSYEKAFSILSGIHQLEIEPLSFQQVYGRFIQTFRKFGLKSVFRWIYYYLKNFPDLNHIHLNYPMVGSYSDIAIVPANYIREFSHYCGIFASAHLFVEFALPTALLLACDRVTTEKDLDKDGLTLWTEKDLNALDHFEKDLQKLIKQFPEQYLYIHPIKLSEWT